MATAWNPVITMAFSFTGQTLLIKASISEFSIELLIFAVVHFYQNVNGLVTDTQTLLLELLTYQYQVQTPQLKPPKVNFSHSKLPLTDYMDQWYLSNLMLQAIA